MRFDRMTTKAQEALRGSIDYATRRGNPELYPEHLLRELLLQDGGIVSPIITNAGGNPKTVGAELDKKIGNYPRVSGASGEPALSRRALAVFQRAEDESKALKDEFISTEHLLLAAAKVDRDFMGMLERVSVTYDKLLAAMVTVRGSQRVTDREPERKFQ